MLIRHRNKNLRQIIEKTMKIEHFYELKRYNFVGPLPHHSQPQTIIVILKF